MACPSTRVLLRMLEPWLVRARSSMGISLNAFVSASHIKRDLWITWNLPEDGKFAIEDAETMELLELFVRVDYEAAWRTILDMTNNAVHLKQVVDSAVAGDALYPCYRIVGLHRAFQSATLNPTLRWLLFSTDPEEFSPMYYAVRQTLLQCWADRHRQGRSVPFSRGLDDRIQLDLHLDLPEGTGGAMLEMAVRIMQLLEHPSRLECYDAGKRPFDRRHATPSLVFTLKTIYLALDAVKVTDSMLRSIQGLWKSFGVFVDSIGLGALKNTSTPQVKKEFFCSALLSDVDSLTPVQFQLFEDVCFEDFTAACSAIANSQTIGISTFDLPENAKDHSQFWQWIAYAVFSADATHQLQHVNLFVGNLCRKDVHSFREVLKARDPLAYVSSHELVQQSAEEKATRAPSVVEIKPNATLLVANEEAEFKSENRIETLRVVQQSPDMEHVAVVYPGAGVCFVHRSDIVQFREISRRKTVRKLQSLSLSIRVDTDLAELTRMLKWIGAKAELLTILGECDSCLNDEFFTGLFAACPQLCSLTLDIVDVASFNWLESVGSRLKSLSLSSVDSRQRGGYKRLLAMLGSAKTQIVEVHIQTAADHIEKLMDDIVHTLEANQSIERLLLSVGAEVPDDRVSTAVAQRLEALNGSLLDGPPGLLPIKGKLAFLSVLDGRQSRQEVVRHEPEATAQFDAVIISRIFGFAAPRKQRVCGFIPTIDR